MDTTDQTPKCEQILYATGEPCSRTANLVSGFDSHGSPISRCRRHAKSTYGFLTTAPSAEQVAQVRAMEAKFGLAN